MGKKTRLDLSSGSYNVLNFEEAYEAINNKTYTDYYYRLMLLARTRFEYENLPNGINEKWLERYLYNEGKCMFFKDDLLGFMVAKIAEKGILNEYDEPRYAQPVATNYTKFLDENGRTIRDYKVGEECVIIRNNDLSIPTRYTIDLFAMRLTEIQRTIDINVEAQQTPVLITGSNRQIKTLETVYKKWKGHAPVLHFDDSLDNTVLNVLKTDAPIVFDKLQVQKENLWNEVLTFLGINNTNINKRERLISDEVNSNNEHIELSAECMLKARQQACDEINQIFGTNIKVKLRGLDKGDNIDD